MLACRSFFWAFLVGVCMVSTAGQAQELFVFTEPASNMPAKSFGLRLNTEAMPKSSANQGLENNRAMYRLNPELMWGIHKNWMVHLNAYASNMHQTRFQPEAASVYTKYRFLSHDEVHAHFRLAAYAKAAISNNTIQYNDVNLSGDNSGWSTGLVATQLLHKLAISFTGGYVRNLDNMNHALVSGQPNYGLAYNLSFGYLTLPITYTSYNQPNVNVYVEWLGKANPATHESYLDIAPSAQVILKSRMRIDLGFRQQLMGSMLRINTRAAMLRFEYSLFNVYK